MSYTSYSAGGPQDGGGFTNGGYGGDDSGQGGFSSTPTSGGKVG